MNNSKYAVVLIAMACLSLYGCGSDKTNKNSVSDANTTTFSRIDDDSQNGSDNEKQVSEQSVESATDESSQSEDKPLIYIDPENLPDYVEHDENRKYIIPFEQISDNGLDSLDGRIHVEYSWEISDNTLVSDIVFTNTSDTAITCNFANESVVYTDINEDGIPQAWNTMFIREELLPGESTTKTLEILLDEGYRSGEVHIKPYVITTAGDNGYGVDYELKEPIIEYF